jgi:hypothetical protein
MWPGQTGRQLGRLRERRDGQIEVAFLSEQVPEDQVGRRRSGLDCRHLSGQGEPLVEAAGLLVELGEP